MLTPNAKVTVEQYRQTQTGKRWIRVLEDGVVIAVRPGWVRIWDIQGKYQAGPQFAEWFPGDSKLQRLNHTGTYEWPAPAEA